jgi:hypothetical protein
MRRLPTNIPGPQYRFLSPSADDASLFAFVGTLRLSVRARVAEEKSRGVPFLEIVAQVREMVCLAESATNSNRRDSSTFRAISKQAVAWCLEAYRPAPGQNDLPRDRFLLSSPT